MNVSVTGGAPVEKRSRSRDGHALTLVGDIIHHDDTVRTTVIRSGDGTETFLTGGVPLIAHTGSKLGGGTKSETSRENEQGREEVS